MGNHHYDRDGVCGKCKGKGWVNEVVQNGVCFWCMGHGSVEKFQEIHEREMSRARLRDIARAKEFICIAYLYQLAIEKGIPGHHNFSLNSKRDYAKNCYEILRRNGVHSFNVDEIRQYCIEHGLKSKPEGFAL